MIRVALVGVLLVGCGDGKTAIDITLVSDPDLTDEVLAAGRMLHVDATGADEYQTDVMLDHGLARTERILYEAGATSGRIHLGLILRDGAGDDLAFSVGDTNVTLAAGAARAITIQLSPTGSSPDMMEPPDLTGADLSGAPADLSGIDMGPFVGGASKCPVGGALLCEGWEAGPYPGFWNFGSPPSPVVDTQRVARGSHALLMALPAGTGYSGIGAGEQMTFPHAPPIYVRMFVNLGSPRVGYDTDLLRIDQSGGANQSLNVGMDPGGHLTITTTNVNPGFVRTSSLVIPTDVWTCIEIGYDSLTNGNEKVWVGDVEKTDVEGAGLNLSAAFDEVTLFYDYSATSAAPATKVWYDEVVVSTTRTGCSN